VSLQDVTDAVAASEALRRQALYDSLTGLPNRRLLDDELHRTIGRNPLPGETVALLVMDLDQFKEVNDALGHHVGDELLRSIGDRLTRELDESLVARLGGDEFAVVLTGLVDEAAARNVADRIRKTLAEPFLLDDVRLQSNASIGIAMYPQHALDASTLIQRADVAMYMAKRSGAGVAVYAAEHDRSSVERLTLIGDLPDAASAGQFVLHFQPCVDLRTGAPVRVEALIRWQHPRLGLLFPDSFVELAELSGAIQPLTRWVIREGLRAADEWRSAGHSELGLAVNLSVRNLYDPDLVTHIEDALAEHDLPPDRLMLELTESELMDDPSLAREVFTAIGELGVHTSIDDFGTGYSSLSYLRDLPLQEIKVDRSFVEGMHRQSDEFTIVRSMIDLGHNLGLEVVAEGVEHADDLRLLRRLGCDLAQGYRYSRPLPLADLLTWLETYDPAGYD
jgi:diguanylate cyclase (GGDEF)-like protein